MDGSHEPDRSTWRCKIDGSPYPCTTAKLLLLLEHGRQGVAAYVRPWFALASKDLPDAPSGQLLRQVSSWALPENIDRLLAHPPWCRQAGGICRDGQHRGPLLTAPPASSAPEFLGELQAQLVAVDHGPTVVRVSAVIGRLNTNLALVSLPDWTALAEQIASAAAQEQLHAAVRQQLTAAVR